jgi:hypothetical protein
VFDWLPFDFFVTTPAKGDEIRRYMWIEVVEYVFFGYDMVDV